MMGRLLDDDRADIASTLRCWRTRLEFERIRKTRELERLLDRAADSALAGRLLGGDPGAHPARRPEARLQALPEAPELP